jgi:hypothetical protein
MHTIRTHFGGLDVGDYFIHKNCTYKKISAFHAVCEHTTRNTKTSVWRHFAFDHLVEVSPE